MVSTEGLGRAIETAWQEAPAWGSKVRLVWSLESEVLKNAASARVFCCDKIYRVGELWLPAQPPALALSSPKDKDALVQLNASAEEDKEKLTPTG